MREQSGRTASLLAVPLAVVFVLALTVPCHAAPTMPRAGDDEAAAVELLTRAMRVAKQTAYQGVQKVHTWSSGRDHLQTLEIANVPDRGTYVSSATGSSVSPAHPDGSTTGPQLQLLADNYTLLRAGVAKMAGRLTDIVDARSDSEVQARYWLDRSTGLMLRREVFDAEGQLARRSWFSRISFDDVAPDARRQAADAPPAPGAKQAQQQVIALRDAGKLRRDGWTVPAALPDGYHLYDVRTTGSGEGKALHLSYSDGISAVSVFEQRGHLEESRMSAWHHASVGGRTVYVRDTVPRQLMWAGPGIVFTVVADAPDKAVDGTVRMLPGADESPGVWGRIVRGLGRIVSWCNPF